MAFVSATLAIILVNMAAIGLQGVRDHVTVVFDALAYIAVKIPGIVVGIATFIALATVFSVLNPRTTAIWPPSAEVRSLSMRTGASIAPHTMALVIIIVRTRLGSF